MNVVKEKEFKLCKICYLNKFYETRFLHLTRLNKENGVAFKSPPLFILKLPVIHW